MPRPAQGVKAVVEPALGRFQGDMLALGVTQGNVFEPEMIVEMQVQQRPVQVQQHAVDGGPLDRSFGIGVEGHGRQA